MAKMYTSRVLENLHAFPITQTGLTRFPKGHGLIRNPGDMFLVWKTIEYFKPNTLLEIGFYGGQSMGLYLEAGGPYDKIVAVDIIYRLRSTFDELFPSTNIEFIQNDSTKIDFAEKFDFIVIDGSHDYEFVNQDVKKCLPLLHANSILYMDEYDIEPGVKQTIEENLLGQYDWVPFLAGPQGMFFHHVSHSADNFLDVFVQDKADNFLMFTNQTNWNGFTVLFCKAPLVYTDNINFFIDVLKYYDL